MELNVQLRENGEHAFVFCQNALKFSNRSLQHLIFYSDERNCASEIHLIIPVFFGCISTQRFIISFRHRYLPSLYCSGVEELGVLAPISEPIQLQSTSHYTALALKNFEFLHRLPVPSPSRRVYLSYLPSLPTLFLWPSTLYLELENFLLLQVARALDTVSNPSIKLLSLGEGELQTSCIRLSQSSPDIKDASNLNSFSNFGGFGTENNTIGLWSDPTAERAKASEVGNED